MADKRLKAMLRSPAIRGVLGNYGFKEADVVAGVALAATAVLGDENGQIRTVNPDGRIGWSPMVQVRLDVNSYAKLAAIPTVDVEVGAVLFCKAFSGGGGSAECVYILEAGSNSTSTPTIQRPDDFDSATNTKIWVLWNSAFGRVDVDELYVSGYAYFDNQMYLSPVVYGGSLPSAGALASDEIYVDGSGFLKRYP